MSEEISETTTEIREAWCCGVCSANYDKKVVVVVSARFCFAKRDDRTIPVVMEDRTRIERYAWIKKKKKNYNYINKSKNKSRQKRIYVYIHIFFMNVMFYGGSSRCGVQRATRMLISSR